MKYLCFSVVCFLCLAGMAVAQPPQGGPPPRRQMDMSKMAQMRANQMTKELSLNARQKTAVLSLIKEYAPKMMPGGPRGEQKPPQKGKQKPPKNGGQRPPQGGNDMHKRMENQEKAFNVKLQKILTAAQYQKYLKNEASRRQQHGGGPGGNGQPPMPR
jgi:Spy/CpxP family protein refolding chaperone